MRAARSWLGLLGTLALVGLPASAGAQPVGSEFQINTYTTSSQRTFPAGGHLVAADASGNFVVVWNSYAQDGSGGGVFGQRFDSGGVAQGDEFQVNSYTTNHQGYPSVAAAADGDFVVVWSSYRQDGSGDGIFGQRYDSLGGTLGSEFRVNSFTTSLQRIPSVASDEAGNFVVVWESLGGQDGDRSGVFGQRYDSSGEALGNEFRVNSYTTGYQGSASVAASTNGDFVVAWGGRGQGDGIGVFGKRYDRSGAAQGGEFRVNSYTTRQQRRASVASDASGNFVVVWISVGQDGSDTGIFGQRFDHTGAPLGSEFRVNSYTTIRQENPSAASDASGSFVVVWSGSGPGDVSGVFGQRYDSAGEVRGGEFQINSFITGAQRYPSVGYTGRNQFVVAWESSHDGSGSGVFGQRFDFGGDTITVESPNTNVKWRIGSLQRIKWTHNLGLDASFRIELDRDDDGSYEELIAAEAPADGGNRGHFAWTVTGPPSATARVRGSWTDDPSVADASDVTFQIRPAP